MKILFVSQHYRPEPCDTRTSQLAAGLARRGYKSAVLTSFPNYPFGKVYEGYRQSLRKMEKIDGVDVVRVPMFPDHSRSKKRRALSYLSFGISASFLGMLFTRKPDLIWIHHPPLTTGIAGYLLAKLKRVPYVYEIHDLWPETLMSTGMIGEGRVTKAIRKVCHWLHQRAAAIIVTSPGMKDHLASQGIQADKISVIPQWADEASFAVVDKNKDFALDQGLSVSRNVVFAGNLGIAQGLDTILDAAKLLKDLPDFQMVLIGDGVDGERIKERCRTESINNVRFLGQMPATEVSKAMAWAEGAIIHLNQDPLFSITIPSKTQAYLACGIPILCGVEGDAAKVVEDARAGFCFTPECPEEMAAAIRRLLECTPAERDQLSANALTAFRAHFSKETLLNEYEQLFANLTGRETVRLELAAERKAA